MLFFFIRLLQVEPRSRYEYLRFTPSGAQSEAYQELLAALESTAADSATASCDCSTCSYTEIASRVAAAGLDTGLARRPRDSGSLLVVPNSQVEEERSHMHPCVVDESSSDGTTDSTDEEEAPDEISSASSIEGNARYTELGAGDGATPSSSAGLAAFLLPANCVRDDVGSPSSSDDLEDAVGKFSYRLCMEEFENGLPSSTAIVYFSGMLGFTPDGSTFARPSKYTPKLSAMIYCIRLCVLERMLPRFSHPKICWPMRPRTGGLKHFMKFRDRFMCHGCQSSTGELLSLRSYGRTLSRADGPNFRVHWDQSGDTVGWEGGTLSMDQLRSLGRKALERAQHSMDRLLYGTRPIVSLEDLQDKMSIHRQGYSFVAGPANKLERSYLNLSTKAFLHPMFASPDKVDKHWQSDVLTGALKNLTQELYPQPLGVQIYRQLSIAATERHVKEISRPFDLNDDKSTAADIEVVFAWQSGHRPMQRGTSYGIDAAYPDSLQPALLRVGTTIRHVGWRK
jgi:hypothetical protein